MSRTLRFALYIAAVALPPVMAGAVRAKHRLEEAAGLTPIRQVALETLPPTPAYDPSRPTVAVLLGDDLTEVTDALGPYEIFARSGRYNVYMVAPSRRPTRLTGGLAIVPHFSLRELDTRLEGKGVAVVVVPNIPNIKTAANRPLLAWMRRQAASGAIMHSWCDGAFALAESGLLDGHRATAHWGDIRSYERAYPSVTWVRGVRWVEDGRLVSSAGINAGIDASLRVLARLHGDSVARRVAAELHYPNYRYVEDPTAPQYEIKPADAILLANAAFRPNRERIGVALDGGLGELDIANIYDAYATSGVADVQAVASTPAAVHTRFGVTLLPSLVAGRDDAAIRSIGRLLVLGSATPNVKPGPATRVVTLGASDSRYALEAVLEDLARNVDVPSARFAEKRLEYRSSSVVLQGSTFAWPLLPIPLALGSLGALLAWVLLHAGRRTRLVAAAAVSIAMPSVAHGQPRDTLPSGARVRVAVYTGGRTWLRRPKTQSLEGKLLTATDDSIVLAVRPGAEGVRIPRSEVRDTYVSLGVPNRFEAAGRSMIVPTVTSAVATAISMGLRRPSDSPPVGRTVLANSLSTAAVTGTLGLIFPKERWRRTRAARASLVACNADSASHRGR